MGLSDALLYVILVVNVLFVFGVGCGLRLVQISVLRFAGRFSVLLDCSVFFIVCYLFYIIVCFGIELEYYETVGVKAINFKSC